MEIVFSKLERRGRERDYPEFIYWLNINSLWYTEVLTHNHSNLYKDRGWDMGSRVELYGIILGKALACGKGSCNTLSQMLLYTL